MLAASNGTDTPFIHIKPPHSHHKRIPSTTPIPLNDSNDSFVQLHHDHPLHYTRQRRYILAEQRLSESFARCASEATPQQLQIRALERANGLLKALAYDSSVRAQRLRDKLATMEARKAEYTAGRLEAGVDEVKRVLLQVKHGETDGEETGMQGIDKKDANLARFFASSQSRTCRRRTVAYRPPKRMSKGDVKPFRLASVAPFTANGAGFTRLQQPSSLSPSHSLTTDQLPTSSLILATPTDTIPLSLPEPADTGGQTMKRSSVPPPIDVSRSLSPVDEDEELESSASSSEGCSTLATPTAAAPFPTLPSAEGGPGIGFVTIIQPRVRTKSQLWKDVQPKIPDYAADLLKSFNDTAGNPAELKLEEFEVQTRWSESVTRTSSHTRRSTFEEDESHRQRLSMDQLKEEEEDDEEEEELPHPSISLPVEPEQLEPTASRPSLDPTWSVISIPSTIPPPPSTPRRLSRFLDGGDQKWSMSFSLSSPKKSSPKKLQLVGGPGSGLSSPKSLLGSGLPSPRKKMATLRHKLSSVSERSSTADERSASGSKESVDIVAGDMKKPRHRFSFKRS